MRAGHARHRRPGRTARIRRHLDAGALWDPVWDDAQPNSGVELFRRSHRTGWARHVRRCGAVVASDPARSPDRLPGHHFQRPLHHDRNRARVSKSEFDAVGVPREESRQRFNETLDILELAFSGKRFSYDGEIFMVPEMSLRPEPQSSDLFSRIYSSSSTAESLEILARRGMVPLFVRQQADRGRRPGGPEGQHLPSRGGSAALPAEERHVHVLHSGRRRRRQERGVDLDRQPRRHRPLRIRRRVELHWCQGL